ncbi:hypothetical protein AB0P28_14665 [Pseudarthrobacter sp. NPDC089323]
MTDFWDADDDVDYEAHHEALERDQAATKAAALGRPALAAALYHFGLQQAPGSEFTPELLYALIEWEDLMEAIEGVSAIEDVKALQRQAEELERGIQSLCD